MDSTLILDYAQALAAPVKSLMPAGDHPGLQAFSAQAERLPEFGAAPHGAGTCHNGA